MHVQQLPTAEEIPDLCSMARVYSCSAPAYVAHILAQLRSIQGEVPLPLCFGSWHLATLQIGRGPAGEANDLMEGQGY
jgi:hypothetical protein